MRAAIDSILPGLFLSRVIPFPGHLSSGPGRIPPFRREMALSQGAGRIYRAFGPVARHRPECLAIGCGSAWRFRRAGPRTLCGRDGNRAAAFAGHAACRAAEGPCRRRGADGQAGFDACGHRRIRCWRLYRHAHCGGLPNADSEHMHLSMPIGAVIALSPYADFSGVRLTRAINRSRFPCAQSAATSIPAPGDP